MRKSFVSSENVSEDQLPDDDNSIPIPPELIEYIPEEKRGEFIQKINEFVLHVEQYSGPIPPPGMLADYEQVMPGSGDRILTMSEQQQIHRIKIQEILVNAAVQHEKLGMWRGFILALTIIASGTLVILSGFSLVGFAMVTAPAIAIATVFLSSSRDKPQTKPDKLEKPSSPPKLPDS